MDHVAVPEEVKKEIRSILLSKVGGVRQTNFQKDFAHFMGHPLNLKALKMNRLSDLIEAIPDVAVIERSEKDGQNYIRGVRDPNMFMNRTACKAQYKPKPKSKQLVKPARKTATTMVELDMNSELVQQWSEELVPNLQGLYAVACIKNNMTREDIDKVFSEFGDIVEVGFASKYAFVRYGSQEEALQAVAALHKCDIKVFVPKEKASTRQDASRKPDTTSHYNSPKKTTRTFDSNWNPDAGSSSRGSKWGTKAHNGVRHPDAASPYQGPKKPNKSSEANRDTGEDLVEMFVGNVPFDTTEADLVTLFGDFNIVKIRMKGNDTKRFAFVQLPSAEVAQMVKTFHKKKCGKYALVVANVKSNHSDSGAQQSPPSNGPQKYESSMYQTPAENNRPPLPNLESGLPMPDLESNLPLPGLESNLPLPSLEMAADEYEWDGSFHGQTARYNSHPPRRTHPSELFVSNFPFGTTELDLLRLFASFGATYVHMGNTLSTDRSTWALISFNSEEERDEAFINNYDTFYNNRPLVVNIAYSSNPPEIEFAMRVQVQPEMLPVDDLQMPSLDDLEMPPANDCHENFLVTVPTDTEASQRRVQKVITPGEQFQPNYPPQFHGANGGVSQLAPYHQRAPLLVQPSNGPVAQRHYSSEPPPLEADNVGFYHQMARLSLQMSNGMAQYPEPPPPLEYVPQQFW